MDAMITTVPAGERDLLAQQMDALVNAVNIRGVMGKGIALQFKLKWPGMFRDYVEVCRRGDLAPGRLHVWETGSPDLPRFVINFPTKRHWRSPSRLEDVEAGLAALVRVIREYEIRSIAIPALGCGTGGLDWGIVEPRIREALSEVGEAVEVMLFAPQG